MTVKVDFYLPLETLEHWRHWSTEDTGALKTLEHWRHWSTWRHWNTEDTEVQEDCREETIPKIRSRSITLKKTPVNGVSLAYTPSDVTLTVAAEELTARHNALSFILEESILNTPSKLLRKPFDQNLSTKPFDSKPFVQNLSIMYRKYLLMVQPKNLSVILSKIPIKVSIRDVPMYRYRFRYRQYRCFFGVSVSVKNGRYFTDTFLILCSITCVYNCTN